MKKFIGILVLFSLTFLFSTGLYAQEANIDDAKSMLSLSDEDLIILAEEFEENLINVQKTRLIETRINGKNEYNIIGDLILSSDFSRMRMTTFAQSKTFSGQARVGTQVGITVFSIDEQNDVVIQQQKSVDIGMSRLFNESINLSNTGSNYILIAAKSADGLTTKYALYNIVHLEEEKKIELENMKIDFFDQAEESNNTSLLDQLSQKK